MDEGPVPMLRAKVKSLSEHVVIANKSVLEAEKERDKLHKELELIDVKLQGKRTYTHDDTSSYWVPVSSKSTIRSDL